ncbi:MAG: hypothetical protein IJ310_02955 [Clostridia bacterium]|nr:hypothetical protein [Clostridia bacterium]
MTEKKKVWFHRILWASLSLFFILLPIIIDIFQPKLEIVSDNASIVEYYESLNETACEVNVEFNRDVYGGYIEVAFYDASGNFLDCDEYYFYSSTSNNNIVSNTYIVVPGEADSYEIISHSIEPATDYYSISGLLIITIPMFISALFVNYQERKYNGKTISVYAGFFHNTLRVNGELVDSHNTLTTYSTIYLETIIESNEENVEPVLIEASITLTNRIAIKANKKLLKDSHFVDANEKIYTETKIKSQPKTININAESQSTKQETITENKQPFIEDKNDK